MWLTWGLTIIIGASWFTKMIRQRRILFQRTPLDIPIALFLVSQIISTIFSWDVHVSMFGYYSRFNGGLLSIVSYIFLYYAFLSNFKEKVSNGKIKTPFDTSDTFDTCSSSVKMVKRLLSLSLISGLIVALWGLPSHFGYDPTCFVFRGTFDDSCWTADFMPRARIFSTLGQPNWLAAYLAILIPITTALILTTYQKDRRPSRQMILLLARRSLGGVGIPFSLLILFYVDLLYSGSRSGFLGTWIAVIFFFVTYRLAGDAEKVKKSLVTIPLLLFITFIIGTPFNQLHKLTLDGIKSSFSKPNLTSPKALPILETQNEVRNGEGAGTESGIIRKNVWPGAINVWRNNPLFGTGVETFTFAYYKYKPVTHNLISEWNFLYNKAHNEYLNYLATTGTIGLGTYLAMIIVFLCLAIKRISKSEFLISNEIQNSKSQLGRLEIRSIRNLIFALLASYVSILITNFFGFSIVITNIYLFMIPAFVFVLGGILKPKESGIKNHESRAIEMSLYQWIVILFVILASLFMIQNLFKFWLADINYALGYNLDRAGEYQQGYEHLHKAVELRRDEPVFKDELSINDAIIAAGLIAQKDQSQSNQEQTLAAASSLIQEAINTSNEIVSKSPNNVVFWKTRARLFHTLSQVDSRYSSRALDGIQKASLLAPNDANIWYNLGVLYGQNNNIAKGIEALEKTIKLKPDYRDARYALGLYYHMASMDEQGKVVVNQMLNQKALFQMQYILDHLNPQDSGALESIKSWENS